RLSSDRGFRVDRVIDMTSHASGGHFLEGTGSMVLDRVGRVAYACISPRTTLEALADFGQRLDYDIVTFSALDRNGIPIYHTNVMMSIGEDFAVICDESIEDPDQRDAVWRKLEDSGKEVISITRAQMRRFVGNCLQLEATNGSRLIAMSRQAEEALEDGQLKRLRTHGRIVSAPIQDIERSAGGSVRCMLAEIHLPVR
ncbi:MAG: arginine deiminase-related protein, partial [Chromatiales bacterium]|nr:arginine deiminase-related protein [Chromatiales bacterium]